MLDPKHKNIAATVSMINIIAQKEAAEVSGNSSGNMGTMLAKAVLGDIDKLFMVESSECDFKLMAPNEESVCVFNGSTETNKACMIANCPLGALVDKELKDTADGIDMEFGADPDPFGGSDNFSHHSNIRNFDGHLRTIGGHIHIGYTGWRKLWHEFKSRFILGWGEYFKGWWRFLCKKWKTNLLVVVVVIATSYLSGLAGKYSIHLF